MTLCSKIDRFKLLTIDTIVNGSEWINEIDDAGTDSDEKLALLMAAIECPEGYYDFFGNLVELLGNILRKNFNKKYKIHVNIFGSSAAGLALKLCDLDIFIDFEPPLKYDKAWFLKLRRIFQTHNKVDELFTNMIYIDARVPILKCTLPFGVQCDISSSNKMALQNTRLIKFYLSLNKTYRPLFLLVKLWMKRRGSSLFRGYLTALLVIFYLQQKELLPSVHYLQQHPKADKQLLLNGWNCQFLDNITHFQNIVNQNLDAMQLFLGFFIFYSNFEFGLYIISPNQGKKILKTTGAFLKPATFFITVQDVFQLDFCVSAHIPRQALLEFQHNCQQMGEQSEDSNLSWSILLASSDKPNKKKKKKKVKDLFIIMGNVELEGNTEDEVRDNWLKKTLATVEQLLLHVARVEIISKDAGSFTCRTLLGQIFNKKSRSKLRPAINSETKVCLPELNDALNEQATISMAVADSAEPESAEPIDIHITYSLKTEPTLLEFEVECTEQNVANYQNFKLLHEIRQSFASWISQI